MKNTGRKTVKGGNTSAPMVAKSSSKSRSLKSSARASTTGGPSGAGEPSHEQLAARSFEIYLSRGAAPGHDLDDWFQAVRELQG